MKRYFLLSAILFISILSYAQYDFLRSSLENFSTAPSYLVVKVKSPSYEGEAAILNGYLMFYYKKTKNKSLKWKKYVELAYQDIKEGKHFIISDEDFIRQNFEKIIIDEATLNNSKKGIEFFIYTYFGNSGTLQISSSLNVTLTIIKVLFDAGIKTGIGCEWSNLEIQDSRFYNEDGFIIPPEYRDSE